MARARIEDTNTGEIYEFYMEPWLKRNLDDKIIPTLTKKDEDYVLVIDGEERSGKSTLAQQIGKYVDNSLTITRVCLSPDEFRTAIVNAEPHQCVIFDEAYGGMGSAGVLSETNRIIKGMVMEMGQKNLFVIIVLPTFYLLDKYVALFRARGLLHVFRSKGQKGYWRFYNKKKKRILYLSKGKQTYSYDYATTRIRSFRSGRFYGKYVIDEMKYRQKKRDSLVKTYKSTKSEKYNEQRDNLVYTIKKEMNLSLRDLSKLCKLYKIDLSFARLGEIIRQMEKKFVQSPK